MKYVLGLDLGIASVGWSLLQKDDNNNVLRIVDLGTMVFERLEDKDGKLENVNRREKRSMRRLKRRKKNRLKELRQLFVKEFEINYEQIDFRKYQNPFEIKVAGLTRKLGKEELMIALYHYMKYRGFKSNRKVEDKKTEGKLLDKIEGVRAELTNGTTITKYLLDTYEKQPIENRRMHNTNDQYFLTVSRDMYLDEITKLFSTQTWLSQDFKDKFIALYIRRRDFSEGPGKGSKFGAKDGESFLAKMIGRCDFDNELRAPRESYSAKSFVLLSQLNNLRYKKNEGEKYIGLSSEQIKLIFEMAKNTKEITYKSVFSAINIDDVYRVKGLEFSKKQYIKHLADYKKEKNIDGKLNEEQVNEFRVVIHKLLFETKFPGNLASYVTMKKAFINSAKKLSGKEKKEVIDFSENYDNYDDICVILLTNKSDERITEECRKKGYCNAVIETILTLPELKQTIDLSLPICKRIIPLLLEGKTYDRAMEELEYNHTNALSVEKCDFLPEIDVAMEKMNIHLTNPNVRHTLVNMRKIINTVIKKYGYIDEYNIEMSRELKKSFKERKEIRFNQIDNQNHNSHLKEKMLQKYDVFKSIYDIRKDDVIKYKLFIEQGGRCAYTNNIIIECNLFNDNYYQIDHILPYSRSYDDSYTNKVLVETQANQEKGNRLPLEAFKDKKLDLMMSFIYSSNISDDKRDKMLAKEIDDDFIERNKVDTSYMARLARNMIMNILKPNSCQCPSGSITDKLKHMWKLKGHTHSFIDADLKNRSTYILKSFAIQSKEIVLELEIAETKQKRTFELSIKEAKKNGKLSESEQKTNETLSFFITNSGMLDDILSGYLNKSIGDFISNINSGAASVNVSIRNEYLIVFANKINVFIQEDRLEKDRNNDLHHALDATIIGCVSPLLINRITKYYQDVDNNMIIDDSTGEKVDNFAKFPVPYDDFKNELILRVYERDNDRLLSKLNDLSIYKEHPLERKDVQVLLPTRHPVTYKNGPFTKETYYGMKNGLITKRIPIDKVKASDLEKLFDINGGNKIVYETVSKWLKNNEQTKYPIHPTKGHPIKNIKIIESSDINSRVNVKGNVFAANDKCIKVNVYTKKGDERLFFVPIYYFQEVKEKNNQNVIYEIMWGQGDNSDYIAKEKLKEYDLMCSLPRYTLIEVELKSGGKGLCYSAGVSSGLFEIYSIIGDGTDLIKSNLSGTIKNQYQLTASTIKSIKVRNISVLGKLS